MGDSESSLFTQSITSDQVRRRAIPMLLRSVVLGANCSRKDLQRLGAQRGGEVVSLRSNPSSTSLAGGRGTIALRPLAAMSAERISLAEAPAEIVGINANA